MAVEVKDGRSAEGIVGTISCQQVTYRDLSGEIMQAEALPVIRLDKMVSPMMILALGCRWQT